MWLGCRESTKAADDDYNYALEWLIRALGYALEVPDSCFDGLWDFLTSPRLIPGLRYRDAYDACVAAGLPVALISVIVCEARLPSSARRAFAPPRKFRNTKYPRRNGGARECRGWFAGKMK